MTVNNVSFLSPLTISILKRFIFRQKKLNGKIYCQFVYMGNVSQLNLRSISIEFVSMSTCTL